MNEEKNLLSYWHKLEHFSPAQLSKDKTLTLLPEEEPWKTPIKPIGEKKTFEYTIYLGVFKSTVVNEYVADFFKDDSKDENLRSSNICFASLKLDIEGKYINESLGISTLPWAIQQLENKKINSDNWVKDFEDIKKELEEYLTLHVKETITNADNEVIEVSTVVNNNQLLKLQDKIISLCRWSIKPDVNIYVNRVEKFKTNKATPEADILNSFYVKDLEKLISGYDEKVLPKAFTQYLKGSLGNYSNRIDVAKNPQTLKLNLTPNNYPDGCWPSDYTLSLMQQFAVNTIFNDLSEDNQDGMFSVNGPPGTGKTTLLRDIIAPILVKRAKALLEINHPSDAFQKVGSMYINDNFSPWVYAPHSSLTNGGIVIASSNNGAVENISKELPLKEEVSEQYRDKIDYFKSVAEDSINQNHWGIISAVLGNKQNRNSLVSSLWFNKETKDLQKTLKENKLFDNTEWDTIKRSFSKKLQEVKAEKTRLLNFKNEYDEYIQQQNQFLVTIKKIENTQVKLKVLEDRFNNQRSLVDSLNSEKRSWLNELEMVKANKPSFFTYLFYRKIRKSYKKAYQTTLEKYNQILTKSLKEYEVFKGLETDLKKTESLLKQLENEKIVVSAKIEALEIKTKQAKSELQNNYADNEFWENINSKSSQESCPWYSLKLKQLNSELVIIALKLNEIFILTANATSSRISTTLAGFFEYLKGQSEPSRIEVKAMWDTFFLVVPVVSTTFASVQTMFKDFGKEDIPWLFIDEAGQAVPQAAAGAIWRSKRVGVVGDPFQIEPVVTISNTITDNLSNYFKLDKTLIGSQFSVQSMADRINPLGSYLTSNNKSEWIGIPLKVHRRCIEPMFQISNNIAYDNTMICATSTPKNVSVNFDTSFIHCKGRVDGRHFVTEQAALIKNILIDEINHSKKLPDVFVITPFSEISYLLKSFLFMDLRQEVRKYGNVDNTKMNSWLKSHVGTVHTFQGKQAEGVILCLGLDETTRGAANWASQKPNLLNVAITRAKYKFIAIGDKDIWLKHPYFNQLSKLNRMVTSMDSV